jgi:hypothetical protein
MLIKSKKTELFLGFVLVAVATGIGSLFWQQKILSTAVEKVKAQMTKDQVIKLLGAPTTIQNGFPRRVTVDGKESKLNFMEYTYVSPLPAPWGEGWVIEIDKNDRVLRAYPYLSP